MVNKRTAANGMLLQCFEWHSPSSPTHYILLENLLPDLAKLGVTSLWLPPGCKGNNPKGNGYDIYDLWDLGEFEQKGTRSTKWGSREELDSVITRAKEYGIDIVWDAVLNHKQGGDRTEDGIWAVEVDKEDRRYEICPPKQIQAWLQYDFPGRDQQGMKYSTMKWRSKHFNGVDWDQKTKKNAIYKLIDDPSTHPPFQQPKKPTPAVNTPRNRLSILRGRLGSQPSTSQVSPTAPARRPGRGWAEDVDNDHGNNDFLLFSNIDYSQPEVQQEMINWGHWMVQDIGVDGFRLDAVQHFSFNYTKEWIQRINVARRNKTGRDVFVVGEVWAGEVDRVLKWLSAVQHPKGPQVYSYDAPLLYNFSRISEDVRTRSANSDLRTISRDSLLQRRPEAAVTLVTNHDTQPGQACYTPMLSQLKSLFYAFILLRQEGYPCVFWGDLFGTKGPKAEPPACLILENAAKGIVRSLLPDLMLCRKLFAYGEQKDYWDSPSCIGWTRSGTEARPGCAVVMNISTRAVLKPMQIGRTGEVWKDVLGIVRHDVKIDAKGYGAFPCNGVSVSIFVRRGATGVNEFPVKFALDIYGS